MYGRWFCTSKVPRFFLRTQRQQVVLGCDETDVVVVSKTTCRFDWIVLFFFSEKSIVSFVARPKRNMPDVISSEINRADKPRLHTTMTMKQDATVRCAHSFSTLQRTDDRLTLTLPSGATLNATLVDANLLQVTSSLDYAVW